MHALRVYVPCSSCVVLRMHLGIRVHNRVCSHSQGTCVDMDVSVCVREQALVNLYFPVAHACLYGQISAAHLQVTILFSLMPFSLPLWERNC